MKKKHSKLGTYSNDGLSIGFTEFSDDTLDEMRKIVSEDYQNIEIDLQRQLSRLDDYLKKTFGALFRNEDFVKWYFDRKKINQWGKNLPKISDAELITYSGIYIKELNELTKRTPINGMVEERIWRHDDLVIIELANLLYHDKSYIESKEDFINLFLTGKANEVNWLTSKICLIYLISMLHINHFISETISVNKFVVTNFKIKGREIKNVKQSKEQMSVTPRGSQEINSFIKTYKENGIKYDVTIYAENNVNEVTEIKLNAFRTKANLNTEIEMKPFLKYGVSIPYDGAEIKKAQDFIAKNFNKDKAFISISGVRFTIYYSSEFVRMVTIKNESI